MAFSQKVTDAQIENALWKNFGNVTLAALDLGIHPRTLRIRINGKDRAKYQAVRGETLEQVKDLAEAGAIQHVLNGSEAMIRFTLSRQAADRGWGQKTMLQGDPNAPLYVAPPPLPGDALEDDERDELRRVLEERRRKLASGE